MLKLKDGEYVGVLYDIISDQVIETSPIIRNTPDAAYRDTEGLVNAVNEMADAAEEDAFYDGRGDMALGRTDETYRFVQDHNGIMWDYPVVRAEERQAETEPPFLPGVAAGMAGRIGCA